WVTPISSSPSAAKPRTPTSAADNTLPSTAPPSASATCRQASRLYRETNGASTETASRRWRCCERRWQERTAAMSRLSDDELDEALAVAQSLNSLRLTAAIAELKERRAQDKRCIHERDLEHDLEH